MKNHNVVLTNPVLVEFPSIRFESATHTLFESLGRPDDHNVSAFDELRDYGFTRSLSTVHSFVRAIEKAGWKRIPGTNIWTVATREGPLMWPILIETADSSIIVKVLGACIINLALRFDIETRMQPAEAGSLFVYQSKLGFNKVGNLLESSGFKRVGTTMHMPVNSGDVRVEAHGFDGYATSCRFRLTGTWLTGTVPEGPTTYTLNLHTT